MVASETLQLLAGISGVADCCCAGICVVLAKSLSRTSKPVCSAARRVLPSHAGQHGERLFLRHSVSRVERRSCIRRGQESTPDFLKIFSNAVPQNSRGCRKRNHSCSVIHAQGQTKTSVTLQSRLRTITKADSTVTRQEETRDREIHFICQPNTTDQRTTRGGS